MKNLEKLSYWPIGENKIVSGVGITMVGGGFWTSYGLPDEISSLPQEQRPDASLLWHGASGSPNAPQITLHFANPDSVEQMIESLKEMKQMMQDYAASIDAGKPN